MPIFTKIQQLSISLVDNSIFIFHWMIYMKTNCFGKLLFFPVVINPNIVSGNLLFFS